MRETDNECLASKITDDKCLAYTKTRFDDILIKFIHYRVQTDKRTHLLLELHYILPQIATSLALSPSTKSISVQFLSISESFDLLSISREQPLFFLGQEKKKKLLKETKPLLFLGRRSAQHLLCIGSDPLLTRRLLILSGSNTADGAAPAPAPAAAARFFSSVSNLAVGKTSGLLLGARTPRLRTARASCVAEARRTSATTMASRWY